MFDIQEYKKVLGQFPTGVCVVTTGDDEGNLQGMTVNSFASVSLTPPLILWSIDKSSLSLENYLNAQKFAISILGAHQEDVSNHFASSGYIDKFEGMDYRLEQGQPVINDCSAHLLCEQHQIVEAGDHFIIIGKVIDTSIDENAKSLAYYKSQYAEI